MEPDGELTMMPDLMRSIRRNASQLRQLLALSAGSIPNAHLPHHLHHLEEPMVPVEHRHANGIVYCLLLSATCHHAHLVKLLRRDL